VKTVKLRALLLMSVILSTLSNGVITGTVTFSHALSGLDMFNGSTTTLTGSGTTTFPVTLR
jgi:hypothetical protein